MEINRGFNLFDNSLHSYEPVKDAGLWIKEHSSPEDIIITKSHPQMIYYSQRNTYKVANSSEAMLQEFKELKPKYFVDSIFQPTEQYVHNFPSEHSDFMTPIKYYYLDAQKTQVSLIIYEVDTSKL